MGRGQGHVTYFLIWDWLHIIFEREYDRSVLAKTKQHTINFLERWMTTGGLAYEFR